jgi:type IV pilus assembly protein PilV
MLIRMKRTHEQGFTFVEVMVALVILAIGILALAELQFTSLKGNSSSKATTAAVAVAETKMEEIRSAGYTNIAAEAPTQVTASGLTFTREVQVTTNSPMTNAKTVTVTVSWVEGSMTRTIPMASIFAQ